MKDETRELGLMIQKGVRNAHRWDFGPFSFQRAVFALGPVWSLQLAVGSVVFQIGCGWRTA